ncbi:hypothetical protein D3C71_1207610 [compost metagenome]
MSRRSTRNGGTRPRAASGGKANPANATSPVPIPAMAGNSPPGGTSVGNKSCSRANNPSCASQPRRAPLMLASSPRTVSCRLNSTMVSRRDSPRQRSKALASNRRVAKRVADSATATPDSNTATRLAMFR